MGRKRRRSKSAGAGAEALQPEPENPASPRIAPESKKRQLDDANEARRPAPLKLKLFKLNGAGKVVAKAKSIASNTVNAPLQQAKEVEEDNEEKQSKKKKKTKKKKKSAADAPQTPSRGEKPVPSSTRSIDDLFASLQSAKKEKARADEQSRKAQAEAEDRAQQEKQQLQAHIKKLEAQNTNSIGQAGVNPDPRPVRYDEDGLPIYTEESLHIGKGGDTADCPFDCWCCF